jgi:hypothetical protein
MLQNLAKEEAKVFFTFSAFTRFIAYNLIVTVFKLNDLRRAIHPLFGGINAT